MKDLFGIVSSFDILCGNATYSEYLAQGVEKRGIEVSRIAIPETIQKEDNKKTVIELIKKIKKCTKINIQMEIGLYGSNPRISSKNLAKILKNCPKNTVITIHRTEKKPNSFLRILRTNLRYNNPIKALKETILTSAREEYLFNAYNRIFKVIRKRNFKVITHTNRDQLFLKKYYFVKSIVHPIMWPNSLLKNKKKEIKKEILKIGIFGFISPHKNFPVVIEAFNTLLKNEMIPKNSRLVICGGFHPEGPGYGRNLVYDIDPKKSSTWKSASPTAVLSTLIQKNNLEKKVDWFVGANDNQMAELIAEVDLVIIPYSETGQSGSGITSQAIQFGQKLIMSDTKLTRQHQEFCNSIIPIFDTAAIVSLSSCIQRVLNESNMPRYESKYTFDNILDLLLG